MGPGGFEAGFARVDITPPLGTPLSGYYCRRVSDGVLDPLYARCLALSDGSARALVISIDNVHLHDDAFALVRTEIARRTQLPPEAIFLAMRDYFPVKSAYTKGGYENATSRYAAGTAERLVDGALSGLGGLYGPEAGK